MSPSASTIRSAVLLSRKKFCPIFGFRGAGRLALGFRPPTELGPALTCFALAI
jgi:hypothetical protein